MKIKKSTTYLENTDDWFNICTWDLRKKKKEAQNH